MANFFSQVGQNIKSGFQSVLDFLKPAPGTGVFRPEAAISSLLKGPSTGELLSKATAISAPQKPSPISIVSGTPTPGAPITVAGGQQIGQFMDFGALIGNVRPIITAQPQPSFQPPQPPISPDPTINPSFSGAYQSPEQKAQTEARRIAEAQGKAGQPGLGGGGLQQPAQQGAPGAAGFAGTGAGASLGGAVGGLGAPSIVTASDEDKRRQGKQPQFTMITAQQAQDAARAGQLFGSGQSGVFKDAQGNFYGISNAQVATQFGAPGVAPVSALQPTLQPFQTSLATGPISAEALLKGVPDKLLPTYEQAFKDLDTQIQQNLANQPPLPAIFAMDTPAQAEFRANQPLSGQQEYDRLYQELGVSSKAAEIAKQRNEITALEQGLQTIIKDINDNPELPKGLAARMITDFSNKNAITLKNWQSKLDTLLYEKGELDKNLNARLGVFEKDLTRKETREEQARDNARQNLSNIWTQIANGTLDPELLQNKDFGTQVAQLEFLAGYKEGITAQLKSKAKEYDSIITKENAAGDVSIIGVKGDTTKVISTIKGVGTPSSVPAETTFTDKVVNGRLVRILANKKTGEVISQTDLGSAGEETTADKKAKFVQYLQQVPANTKTSSELEGEARAAGLTIDDDLTAAIGSVNTTSWLRRALGF